MTNANDTSAQSPRSDRAAYWTMVTGLRYFDVLFPFVGLVLLLVATFVVPVILPELKTIDGFLSWGAVRWIAGIGVAATAVPTIAFLVSWRVRHVNWNLAHGAADRNAAR